MTSANSKAICLLLCLALIISAFAACGKTEEETTTQTTVNYDTWVQTAPTDLVPLSDSELIKLVKDALGDEAKDFTGDLSALTPEQIAKVTALATKKEYTVEVDADGNYTYKKNVVLVDLNSNEVAQLVNDTLGKDAAGFNGDLSTLSKEQLKKVEDAAESKGYYVSTDNSGKVSIKKDDVVQSASPKKQEEVSKIVEEVLGTDAANFNGNTDNLNKEQKAELESKLNEEGISPSQAAEIITKEFTTKAPVYETITTNKGTYHPTTTVKVTSSTQSQMIYPKKATAVTLDWVKNVKVPNASFTDCAATSDGGTVSVGTYFSSADTVIALISKIDKNGKILWTNEIEGDEGVYFEKVAVLNNGNILAAGYSNCSSYTNEKPVSVTGNGKVGSFNGFVALYTDGGSLKWAKTFGGSRDDMIYSVARAKDGGILVGGSTTSVDGDMQSVKSKYTESNHTSCFLAKFDANFTKMSWIKSFTATKHCSVDDIMVNTSGEIFAAIDVKTADCDFASFSDADIGHEKTFILKYPANGGNPLFTATICSSANACFCELVDSEDGGCLTAGYYSAISPTATSDGRAGTFADVYNGGNAGTADSAVIKIDSTGAISWKTMFIGFGVDIITGITPISTGYAVSGFSTSTNRDFSAMKGYGDYDSFVCCMDKGGSKQTFACFGGSDADKSLCICTATDNSLVLCGSTASNDKDFAGQNPSATSSDASFGIKCNITVA